MRLARRSLLIGGLALGALAGRVCAAEHPSAGEGHAPPPAAPPPPTISTPLPKKKKKPRPLKDVPYTPLDQIPNHRRLMREVLITLANYGKARRLSFITMIRNAPELVIKERREWLWESGRDPDGAAQGKYSPQGAILREMLKPLDGMLCDGLFYGRESAGTPTDADDRVVALQAIKALDAQGRKICAIEYCQDGKQAADALKHHRALHLVPFIDQSGSRALEHLPRSAPFEENPRHITALGQVRNVLPLWSSAHFASKGAWIEALAATNYDLLIVESYWRGTEPLTREDVHALQYKAIGARRLVLAILPVGRARDTAFYWQTGWSVGQPAWLVAPDPADPAAIVVEFWNPAWKEVLGKIMQGVVDVGFDGVLFDQADSYLPFEEMMPVE